MVNGIEPGGQAAGFNAPRRERHLGMRVTRMEFV